MTDLDQHIASFALKAIGKAGGAVSESFLKSSIRAGFSHIAFTDAVLQQKISNLAANGLIASTDDSLLGTVWDLTPTGRVRAKQIS